MVSLLLVLSAYVYYMVSPVHYQLATSYIKATNLATNVVAGIVGDLLVVEGDVSLKVLLWISAVSVTIGFVVGLVVLRRPSLLSYGDASDNKTQQGEGDDPRYSGNDHNEIKKDPNAGLVTLPNGVDNAVRSFGVGDKNSNCSSLGGDCEGVFYRSSSTTKVSDVNPLLRTHSDALSIFEIGVQDVTPSTVADTLSSGS
jgi:hypothetical protein